MGSLGRRSVLKTRCAGQCVSTQEEATFGALFGARRKRREAGRAGHLLGAEIEDDICSVALGLVEVV